MISVFKVTNTKLILKNWLSTNCLQLLLFVVIAKRHFIFKLRYHILQLCVCVK